MYNYNSTLPWITSFDREYVINLPFEILLRTHNYCLHCAYSDRPVSVWLSVTEYLSTYWAAEPSECCFTST